MMYLMKIYGLVSFYLFDTNLKMVISRFSKIFFPNASEYFLILLISHGVYNFFFPIVCDCLELVSSSAIPSLMIIFCVKLREVLQFLRGLFVIVFLRNIFQRFLWDATEMLQDSLGFLL